MLHSQFGQSADRVDGQDTYTTHYLCILGPKGTNPATGADYPLKDVGTQGGFALGGAMRHDQGLDMSLIRDGTSNTMLLGELSWANAGVYRSWARGADDAEPCICIASAKNIANGLSLFGYHAYGFEFNDASFGSQHPGGAHFANADGSVHFVSESIDLGAYKSMASRAGGEAVAAQ